MINVSVVYNKSKYLFDATLSIKAKGFMALCIAYINKSGAYDTFRLQDLAQFEKESPTAINAAINELIEHGYVQRSLEYTPGKKGVSWVFTFFE